MRELFLLVMTLLVLQVFFPILAGHLEETLLSVLQLIDAILDAATSGALFSLGA